MKNFHRREYKKVVICAITSFLCANAPLAIADQVSCVSDFSSLKSAVMQWKSDQSGSVTTIKLVRGAYDFDNSNGLTLGLFAPASATSLKILGGYSQGCADDERRIDARNTVIDGHDQAGSGITLQQTRGDAIFEGITFTHLASGLQVLQDSSSPGAGHVIRISQCRIVDNFSQAGSPYSLRLWGVGSDGNGVGNGADIIFEDSVIARNNNQYGTYIAIFTTANGGLISLRNSTIVSNVTSYGIQLQSLNNFNAISFDISNNIIWGNGTILDGPHDLDVTSSANPPLINNSIIGVINGLVQPSSTNRSVNPLLVDLPGGNFHLTDSSPAFDSGSSVSITGHPAPAQDVEGSNRVVGVRMDIGAYEKAIPNEFIFVDSFGG